MRLALETAAHHPILNEQLTEISQFEVAQFPEFEAKYGTGVQRRSAPTPRYNCHGMTFASRRTGIFEPEAIQLIIDDDEYQEISPEEVIPGDVIIYFDESGDFEHSGVVISAPNENQLRVPFICSKWGKYAELLHWGNRCPYNFARARYFRMQP